MGIINKRFYFGTIKQASAETAAVGFPMPDMPYIA
jgi:hypothetical protein